MGLECGEMKFECPKSGEVQKILEKNVEQEGASRWRLPANLNISEITDSLFLCSATAVRGSMLNILGVNCVINAAAELPDTPLDDSDVIYCKIPVTDSSYEDIRQYFDSTADLIHKIDLLGGKTVLHCVAGVSRSAALCLAYLMKHHQMSLLQAFTYTKQRRHLIRPNCSFFRQLIAYEKSLFGDNSVSMVYNEYVNSEIPDVYDEEYRKMREYQNRCRSKGTTNSLIRQNR